VNADRIRFSHLMRTRFGVRGHRLRELEADLEPLFQLAAVAAWPEGTDVHHLAPGPRKASDKTPALPEARPAPFQAPDPPVVQSVGSVAIAERYHDHIVALLGYAQLVGIGSLLGHIVLDAIFSDRRYGGESYVFLQTLALYRTAASASGLDTEGAMLGQLIRRFFQEAEAWQEVQEHDIYEEVSVD
jgi:hypothetical protein